MSVVIFFFDIVYFCGHTGWKELSFGYVFLLIGIPTFHGTLHPFGSDTQPNEHHSQLDGHLRKVAMTLTSASSHLDIANWYTCIEASPVAPLTSP